MSHGPEHQIEHAENAAHAAHDPFDRRVTISIAIVAAVLAGVTMLGHRAHNETLKLQGEALQAQTEGGIKHSLSANKWAQYQAQNKPDIADVRQHGMAGLGPKVTSGIFSPASFDDRSETVALFERVFEAQSAESYIRCAEILIAASALWVVPTVHVQSTDRAAIKAYAATPGATATINPSTLTYTDPAPFTASFSSRGPLAAGGGDLLKPDVIAPGQDILAAVAPPGNHGFDFNLYSGTSMSAPHVAGVGALLKQLHPNWSPMAVKSALMTSAYDVLDGPSTNPLVIFRQGAGHIRPNSAADPGLVYDSGFNDWLAFLCGSTTGVSASTCTALAGLGYSFDASDLNVASIAIGDLAGSQTVTRRVTNVGSSAATYTASVSGLAGVTASVSPSSLTINPGQTKTFTVTLTRTTAAIAAYVGGQLSWTDGTHTVRSPIVVRPVALAAPAQVSGNGGPISYNVKFGYTGAFAAAARGLVPATMTAGTVADDPTDSFVPGGPGTTSFSVVVPAGTTYARFSLFNEFTDGNDDIDLYVYNGATRVGASGGGTAAEEVNLLNPAAATYTVWVHGFATDGPDAHFTLFNWVLGSAAAGNMTVTAPATATLGTSGAVSLAFSGLTPGTKYLGSVAYSGSTGLPNPTIVRVDTP